MKCHCDLVFQIEPAYIPSNMPSSTGGGTDFVPIVQYECLRCGKHWGYLGQGVKLIEAPKVLRIG